MVEGPGRANLDAGIRPDTFIFIEGNLDLSLDALGIVAPDTPQRASLEEHNGPDTGTVIQGIPFDLEDEGLFL
jgi:hypothetical protein